MFAIEVNAIFSASHQLRLPGGVLEPLHGHNWHVTVVVESAQLDAIDTVMDFHIVESQLKSVVSGWHNRHLNDIPPFDSRINPSAERIAEEIGRLVQPCITPPARLHEVRITEAPGCLAIWRA